MQQKSYDFNDDKIVFIDWLAIEAGRGSDKHTRSTNLMPSGVRLINFKPEISKNHVLKADKPWESAFIGSYMSIIQDNDVVKLYYEAYPSNSNPNSDYLTVLCYAESKDFGKTFLKPNLGLVEWNGNKNNNIIFKPEMHPNKTGLHGQCVFIDSNPNCPIEEKYKIVYDTKEKVPETGYVNGGYSEDGLNWIFYEKPIAKTWADTQTIVGWNKEKKKYIGFFRSWNYNRRQVYYSETEDYKNWPDPEPLLASDPTLPVDVDFYTNGYHEWPNSPNAHIMMPTNYRRTIDNLYVEMRCSRDLKQWYKMPTNPIIEPEDLPPRFHGGLYLGHGIIDNREGTWSIPVGVPIYYHNDFREKEQYSGFVYLASWREDGFTGLQVNEIGEFYTARGRFKGNKLFVNAWTYPRGKIQVGLYDSIVGKYLPGLSPEDCEIITGKDNIWTEVKWNDNPDLEDFDDVIVRLHFKITRGTIHAFKFGNELPR